MDDKVSLSGQVLYLRGLADGMEIDNGSKESKLLLKIIDTLGVFAQKIEGLDSEHQELSQVVDSIDETLGEIILADADIDYAHDDALYAQDATEDEGSFIEYECPHCHSKVYYDAASFNLDSEHTCPDCNKDLFPAQEDSETP